VVRVGVHVIGRYLIWDWICQRDCSITKN